MDHHGKVSNTVQPSILYTIYYIQTALCTDGKVSNTVQPSIEVPDYQSIVSKHFKQCKYQEQYQVMTMLSIAPD